MDAPKRPRCLWNRFSLARWAQLWENCYVKSYSVRDPQDHANLPVQLITNHSWSHKSYVVANPACYFIPPPNFESLVLSPIGDIPSLSILIPSPTTMITWSNPKLFPINSIFWLGLFRITSKAIVPGDEWSLTGRRGWLGERRTRGMWTEVHRSRKNIFANFHHSLFLGIMQISFMLLALENWSNRSNRLLIMKCAGNEETSLRLKFLGRLVRCLNFRDFLHWNSACFSVIHLPYIHPTKIIPNPWRQTAGRVRAKHSAPKLRPCFLQRKFRGKATVSDFPHEATVKSPRRVFLTKVSCCGSTYGED